MVIRQGEVYWVDLEAPAGSEPGYSHPCVVVQNDVFNSSRISTIVVCALTSNLQRAESPGNVLLKKGEAGLPKTSVVNISQIITVNKSDLKEKIGKLSAKKTLKIIEGIDLLIHPRDID